MKKKGLVKQTYIGDLNKNQKLLYIQFGIETDLTGVLRHTRGYHCWMLRRSRTEYEVRYDI